MTDKQNTRLVVHAVPAGRGAAWLTEGFHFFQQHWLGWLGITCLLFVFYACLTSMTLIPLIPVVGNIFMHVIMNIVMTVCMAGLILACRGQDETGELRIGCLFAGFTDKFGSYVLLGVLYSAGLMLIFIITVLILIALLGGLGFITEIQSGDPEALLPLLTYLLLALLIALLFYVPLLMLFWFAPALVALGNQGVVEAMLNSFRGCLANVVPYLVYGVVGLLLSIAATIPLMLGWLVLTPVIIISIYTAYRDIFPLPMGAGE